MDKEDIIEIVGMVSHTIAHLVGPVRSKEEAMMRATSANMFADTNVLLLESYFNEEEIPKDVSEMLYKILESRKEMLEHIKDEVAKSDVKASGEIGEEVERIQNLLNKLPKPSVIITNAKNEQASIIS